jgi:hypothetical protein
MYFLSPSDTFLSTSSENPNGQLKAVNQLQDITNRMFQTYIEKRDNKTELLENDINWLQQRLDEQGTKLQKFQRVINAVNNLNRPTEARQNTLSQCTPILLPPPPPPQIRLPPPAPVPIQVDMNHPSTRFEGGDVVDVIKMLKEFFKGDFW